MTDFNVAPSTFSENEFHAALIPMLDGARGLGRELGLLPTEYGWDQTSFFEHDLGEHLLSIAVNSLQSFAKANHLFYNKDKLAAAASQALIEAYSDGFIQSRQQVA